MRRIGFYGGTFDPLHHGHLNLAVELMERVSLDEVWFSPARISPHKQDDAPISSAHRHEMLRLAIASHPKFKVYDGELQREGPSYTYETIKELTDLYSDVQWVLLIGEDCIPGLPRWKNINKLIDLLELAIASRRSIPSALEDLPEGPLRDSVRAAIVMTPLMDIDATTLRERLRKRAFCEHLCPQKVLDYIRINNLYLEV